MKLGRAPTSLPAITLPDGFDLFKASDHALGKLRHCDVDRTSECGGSLRKTDERGGEVVKLWCFDCDHLTAYFTRGEDGKGGFTATQFDPIGEARKHAAVSGPSGGNPNINLKGETPSGQSLVAMRLARSAARKAASLGGAVPSGGANGSHPGKPLGSHNGDAVRGEADTVEAAASGGGPSGGIKKFTEPTSYRSRPRCRLCLEWAAEDALCSGHLAMFHVAIERGNASADQSDKWVASELERLASRKALKANVLKPKPKPELKAAPPNSIQVTAPTVVKEGDRVYLGRDKAIVVLPNDPADDVAAHVEVVLQKSQPQPDPETSPATPGDQEQSVMADKPIKQAKPTACECKGCDQPNFAVGMCGTHYSRWQKAGKPDYENRGAAFKKAGGPIGFKLPGSAPGSAEMGNTGSTPAAKTQAAAGASAPPHAPSGTRIYKARSGARVNSNAAAGAILGRPLDDIVELPAEFDARFTAVSLGGTVLLKARISDYITFIDLTGKVVFQEYIGNTNHVGGNGSKKKAG